MVFSPLNGVNVLIRQGRRAKRLNSHTEFHSLWSFHPSERKVREGTASRWVPVWLHCEKDKAFAGEIEPDEITSKNTMLGNKGTEGFFFNPKFSFNIPFLVHSNISNIKRNSQWWYINSSGWSKIAMPQLLQSWTNKLSRLHFHSSKASPFKQKRPLLLQQIQ